MIIGDMLRAVPLLAGVPDSELNTIAGRAADIELHTNEWLIQEGEVAAFFIVLSGRLTVYKAVGGVERAINEFGPGDYVVAVRPAKASPPTTTTNPPPSLRVYAASTLRISAS
jgi:hypothetical protein